ncbi:hypothetical protein BHE74_00032588 [Ensete ventricosum]|nr:hypothetical protein GW17_00007279 [Ensete ventricosum]RWW60417.1 hypothetical protein BHE74_00032588 [Ensete ventricosum]RZR84272.1 hypothetical protein BHM03_00011056 [Ensete ventricosum]
MAEEARILSLDGGRSYAWKQRRRKELCMKARSSDLSVDDRGSLCLVRWRWRRAACGASLKLVAWSRLEVLGPHFASPELLAIPVRGLTGGTGRYCSTYTWYTGVSKMEEEKRKKKEEEEE